MPPYNGAFAIGSRVRVQSRAVLEQFQVEWKYHHSLSDDQLQFADRVDIVADIGYYHGGDPLYRLRRVPGTWHELCLMPAN